ncbi:hypothetical protein AYO21_11776 [Fonsecaea monophora]|uniref:Copper transport protein n=1 Tax=Fonsecaea monophora TaxID=254056 RepID=A0A177ESP4_9EURO|nr:hypothetical protein AYO21_11776 [Fonsecaea monophora]OAG34082.1 hypothetical protein AYO21_11776 [Fonsecaea monophora]
MFGQNQPRSHHPHLALSKTESRKQIPQENCVYMAIALMGGLMLITKPALVVLALLLVGYGRLYHVERHEKSARPWSREHRSEPYSLHLGPGREGPEQMRASLHDLTKGLSLPKSANVYNVHVHDLYLYLYVDVFSLRITIRRNEHGRQLLQDLHDLELVYSFISKSWQVSSDGIFALSCIGVILLVISLEFLRRVQREYDSWIRRKDQKAFALAAAARNRDNAACASYEQEAEPGRKTATNTSMSPPLPERPLLRRPQRSVVDRMTLLQRQCIRSLIHMVQFGVAYFIMLLAMYYNGYIIICIVTGGFLGCFIFSWDQLLIDSKDKPEPTDVTGCCG